MRRSSWALLICGFIGATSAAAEAQTFGGPFGLQRPFGRQARVRRGAVASPAVAAAPLTVPVPVPRPHFASDRSPTTPAQTTPVAPEATTTSGTPTVPPSSTPSQGLGGPPATPPLPPGKPPDLGSATPPRAPPPETPPANVPSVAPSGATNAFTPRQPAEDAACLDRLTAKKVDFQRVDIGKQPDSRCTVDKPIKLTALPLADGSTITFPDRPTIACTTADTFSGYVRDLLAPLAKGSFGASLTTVWTGPGLECRSRDHIFGAKLSAHGQGLAVDIAQLKLSDGRMIDVGTPKSDTDTAFETAARGGACGYFHTVLGPGTDAYHRTHWHFDLEVRGKTGDGKYCR